jgi:deazaflavin-dependent oxidoreductase (nitroreductase family)
MIPPRWLLRIVWAVDTTVSRLSGGRITMPNGSRGRLRTLYLRTVGRTTGQPRRTGLYYLEDGANLVVVASNAGEDRDPAWWLNLQARPDAEVEVGTQVRRVHAREPAPAEAERLYQRFVDAFPTYAEYRQRTTRPIPVVILETKSPDAP